MWTLASMEMRREVDEPGGGGGAGPASRGGEWRGVARDGEGPHLAAAAREGGREKGERSGREKAGGARRQINPALTHARRQPLSGCRSRSPSCAV
jgi:hypothetical protein